MLGIEAGVGLVEQPQLRVSGDQDRQSHPLTLPGGEGADRSVREPAGKAEPLHGGDHRSQRALRSPDSETHVVDCGQVVIKGGRVTGQAHPPAYGALVGDQVLSQDYGFPRRHPEQPGAGPQQTGLTGPVRPLEQHGLTLGHFEVDSRQDRKAANQGDGGAKADDRVHDDRVNGT